MTLRRMLAISATLFFPFLVNAEADGPDYWKIQSNVAVKLLSDKTSPEPILFIPAGTDGLINKGCSGLPSFDEWSNMTVEEREDAKQNAWCRVVYGDVEGWTPKMHLVEGRPPSPSFDCSKASSQVESLICDDAALMLLDRNMHQTYQDAIASAKSLDVGSEVALKTLKAYQRGWIKGRNDCWKATDVAACVKANYQNRISELQAKWMLLPPQKTASYLCADNAEIFITFYNSILPSASLEIGDQRQIYISQGSSNRYEGDFGKFFEVTNQDLTVLWNSSGPSVSCTQAETS